MLRTNGFSLMLLLALPGCADGTDPVGTGRDEAFAPRFNNAAGCYAVKFDVLVLLSSPLSGTGQVTGDLEGTVTINFDPASFSFSGVTLASSGTASWTITGGIVPGLASFETVIANHAIGVDRPGSPPTQSEAVGEQRASSGVQKANLVYHGTVSFVPFPHADLAFHGVICP